MKAWLRRLEHKAKDEMVVISLEGGGEARFPSSDLLDAFLHELSRLKGEHDEPPHPLTVAATNSSDPEWQRSAFTEMQVVDSDGNILDAAEIRDLSE